MNLLKDARDVILATAYVTVMRYVSAERQRSGQWRRAPVATPVVRTPGRVLERASVERPSYISL